MISGFLIIALGPAAITFKIHPCNRYMSYETFVDIYSGANRQLLTFR